MLHRLGLAWAAAWMGCALLALLLGGGMAGLSWQQMNPGLAVAWLLHWLPVSLQLALPAVLLHHVWRLAETGELRAAASMGLAPGRVALVLLVPCLPGLMWMPQLVHDTAPRARQCLAQELRARALPLGEVVAGIGGGVVPRDGGLTALVPVEERVLGLRAGSYDWTDGQLGLQDVELLAVGAQPTLRFAELRLDGLLPVTRLGDWSERDLPSRRLRRDGAHWRRQRPGGEGGVPAGRRLRRELAQRQAVLPCLLGALLPALWLLWYWPQVGPRRVYGLLLPLAWTVALWGPRWVA